jgi:hypothetical protein
MSPLALAIAEHLRRCIGVENAASAPALAAALERPERQIRRTISTEYCEIGRAAGGLICSKPGAGFWITVDAEEILLRHRRIEAGQRAYAHQAAEFQQALKSFGLEGILSMDTERKAA